MLKRRASIENAELQFKDVYFSLQFVLEVGVWLEAGLDGRQGNAADVVAADPPVGEGEHLRWDVVQLVV